MAISARFAMRTFDSTATLSEADGLLAVRILRTMAIGTPEPSGAAIEQELAGTRFGPVMWFEALDSTNRFAFDRGVAGDAGGLVVVADTQTSGRGRLGRAWTSPPKASLLVSVLLRLDVPPESLVLVTPAAALAAADALVALAGIDARLKWPNDLVVDDRKLAGILAEALPAPGAVVVGMGCNVSWERFPEELAATATACNLCSDVVITREELLAGWLARYEERLRVLDTAAGRASLRDDCIARSATLGRRVRVDLPARTLHGVATGLSETGMLEVTGDEGTIETIAAGDVVHLRPAPRRSA
jgi:BirA family biotin operon repressor/biotin-[acetyl-CoA-carboxylase] ligase